MEEKENLGTYMLDGEMIDVNSISIEKLEEHNRKFAQKLENERNNLNDILSDILV